MTLDQGKVGQVYTVTRVGGQGAARRRLLDFGVLPERWWRSSGRRLWGTRWSFGCGGIP